MSKSPQSPQRTANAPRTSQTQWHGTSFADLALKAAKEGLSHEAYLHELANGKKPCVMHDERNVSYVKADYL